MIADVKPYPYVKNSGVSWLGEVPEHWKLFPNRAIFVEVNERNHPDEQMLSVTINKGVIRQESLLSDSSKKDSSNLDKSAYKLVRPGDIVYNKMRAWQGAIGLSDYQGIVSPAYIVQRPRNGVNPQYFHYLMRTPAFAKEAERWSYGITSDMWSLRPEHFKMIYICLPSPDEQKAIVRFLNHYDRKIRRYIHAKQKLIKLLEEQKQAIIHHAVTHGVDPNILLKSSGVEWLGDAPEHWEIARVSQFFTLQRGFDITKENQRKGVIPVVSSGGISSYHDEFKAIGPGVIVGRKGTAGAVYYIETNYWPHDTTLWVYDFKGNYPKYIYYLLINLDLKRFDTGSANPTLNRNVIHPERIAMPPVNEQERIALSIDTRLKSITGVLEHTQGEIELFREYFTRMIVNVVTGKLDVREAAARLPEEIEAQEMFDEDVSLAEDDVEEDDLE